MTDRKSHWEKIYDSKSLDEMSWYQPTPANSLEFIDKLGLPESASIIDIGGGDSLLADHLLERGFRDITLLDISEKAIARARDRLGERAGQIHWIRADAARFEPPRKYDLWHDRAAFHFLTEQGDIVQYLAGMRDAVKPGGYVVIGTFSEEGPEYCSGIRIRQYSEAKLQALMEDAFQKIECRNVDHETPSGSIQNFVYCGFRKNN